MAFLGREELALIGAAQGHCLNIILTRERDEILGLRALANAAKKKKADLFY